MFIMINGHPKCGTTQLLSILKAATLTKCRWLSLAEALDIDVIEKDPKAIWICDAEEMSLQDLRDLIDGGLLSAKDSKVIIIQGPDQIALRKHPEAQPLIFRWRREVYPQMLEMLKTHAISHHGIPNIDPEETVVNIAGLIGLKA
jgi:hypothetical protein